MTKNDIVQELYNSKEINEAISKMEPSELRSDLKQEMFMVLMEMPEERLRDIHEKGFSKFFLIRTMLNMVKSDRSTFYKNFRNFFEYKDEYQLEYRNMDKSPDTATDEVCFLRQVGKYTGSNSEDIILPEVDFNCVFGNTRQGLYEKDMFFYYVFTFDRNAAALSKAVKIPYKTVIRTLSAAKKRIKCYLQSQQP